MKGYEREDKMTKKEKKCEYCGAEIKISKKDNEYCSNICWEKEPYASQRALDEAEQDAVMDSKHGDWGAR